MATLKDDSVPSEPAPDLDSGLPHSTDTGEDTPDSIAQPHDHQHQQTFTEPENHSDEPVNYQNEAYRDGKYHPNYATMEDVRPTTEFDNDMDLDDQHNGEQGLDYGTFPKGFSDDEDAGEELDHSWEARKPKMSLPKSKKSPRRPSDAFDDEVSPKIKKPRQSLFGGPIDGDEEEQPEEYLVGQDDDANMPKTPGEGIRYRMSSLNLEQREKERSPSECPFNLGFGLASSDRGSLSPRVSRAPSEESIIIPPDDQPAYELRQNIERKKAFTYIDTDKSGNFDPSEEAKQNALKLTKAKAAKSAAQQKKGKGKAHASKEPIMKCIVKLHFDAFGNVRNLTNDEDNWPDDWSDLDSEWESEIKQVRDLYRRNTPGRETQMHIEDPGGDVDDLTGYPAARGCRNCRKHEQDCSMIGGGTYPCQQCLENDCECGLILPPTIKGRCKQCDADGKEYCSFEDDPHEAICDHCAENEFICEALPPDGYKVKRIDIYKAMGGDDRQFLACTVCRQEKKRCSLKKGQKPPCKYCKKHNTGCTFFSLPPKPKDTVKNAKGAVKGPTEGDAPEVAVPGSDYFSPEDLADIENSDAEEISRESTPEMNMEDAEGHHGVLTKITTSFAHPIQFSPGVELGTACNFCEMPVFGMVGHFEKTVHVIRWNNGLGYSELGAGHREENDPTVMCQNCTMERVQIILCGEHQLQKMDDALEEVSFDVVAEDLMAVLPQSHRSEVKFQLQRWCSMCFSPASYKCCNSQPSLVAPTGEEEYIIEGCGLRLCERCAVRLTVEFGGDSDLMAIVMDAQPKQSENEDVLAAARADVGFLMKQGLLMRNVEAAMAADEDGNGEQWE